MKWNHVVCQVNKFAAVWDEDLSGSLQFSALGGLRLSVSDRDTRIKEPVYYLNECDGGKKP